MRLLTEFLYVEGVDQRVHIKENFRLLILAIDALRDRYDADTDESELLPDARRIPNISRQATRIVDQDRVKGARQRFCCNEQAFQPIPIRSCARNRFVSIEMVF
jgi:hypothetical protein